MVLFMQIVLRGIVMAAFKNLKLICLDNDDVLFNSSPLIQYHVERNFPKFSTNVLKVYERTLSVLNYQYNMMKKEIEKAKRDRRKPNLPDFNVVRNDVLRESTSPIGDLEYEYYMKPLFELGECIERATNDKEMFLEERDATVEADGKLDNGVIPYAEIYSERNWIPYTRQNVKELYNMFGERLISLTAHNGIDDMHGREFEAKGEAVHRMVKDMKHYGLRFHATEHVPDIRRPRNSKSERIMELYGLDNLRGVVNIDDSIVNCIDIYNHGGSPILISQNKYNEYGFATSRSIKPESICRELEKLGFSDDATKILRKVRRHK